MTLLGDINEFTEGEAYGIDLDGLSIVLIRWHGRFFLYENHCPHRGIRLEWQPNQFLDYERQFIQCAMHGALFRIDDGECIAGPCPGEILTSVPFHIDEGKIYLSQ